MSDLLSKTPAVEQPASRAGAALLMLGGIGAAFGVASCCALPLLFTTLGIGTAWLGGVAMLAAPHRTFLLGVGAVCLIAAAGLMVRQERAAMACAPGGVCITRATRVLMLVGVLIGVGLLWAGYRYV
ncbi:MAG: mercuric reductase [Hyphomicrobiales bacterium]|nr:mercuric reductase [Hyphomicrobiales bacterium]